MGLQGIAWTLMRDPGATVAVRQDWPTLDTLELEDSRVLLAGRDSRMRVISFEGGNEDGKVVFEWAAEGIPTGVDSTSEILAIGGGGAGVSLWMWRGENEPPVLVGRYPFAGYVKEVAFLGDAVLLAADAHQSGLWMLDVSDAMRPRKMNFYPVRSYCDVLAVTPGLVSYSDRLQGTVVAEILSGSDRGPASLHGIQGIPVTPSKQPSIESLDFRGTQLLIGEKASGLRLLDRDETGQWTDRRRWDFEGEVLDAVFLRDGRMAVCDSERYITLIEALAANPEPAQ